MKTFFLSIFLALGSFFGFHSQSLQPVVVSSSTNLIASSTLSNPAATSTIPALSFDTTGWQTYRDPSGISIKYPPTWVISHAMYNSSTTIFCINANICSVAALNDSDYSGPEQIDLFIHETSKTSTTTCAGIANLSTDKSGKYTYCLYLNGSDEYRPVYEQMIKTFTNQPVISAPVNMGPSQTNTQSTSTGVSTVSIPTLPPFMNWNLDISQPQNIVFSSDPSTAYSQYTINLATSLSMPKSFSGDFSPVPAKRWTAQSGTNTSVILNQFRSYYDSILTRDGWSYESIDISTTTIDGVADDGTFSSNWSYLKTDGDNLYMIVLGYSGTIYEVDVSDPIPLKQLGL